MARAQCHRVRVPHTGLWWRIPEEVVTQFQTSFPTVITLQPDARVPRLGQILDAPEFPEQVPFGHIPLGYQCFLRVFKFTFVSSFLACQVGL